MFQTAPPQSHPPQADRDRASSGAQLRCRSAWTPEQLGRAVRLYLIEGFTAADVAYALGPAFTRAAVIGKLRRLGHLKRDVRATADSLGATKVGRLPRRRASSRAEPRLPPQHAAAAAAAATGGRSDRSAAAAPTPARAESACRWRDRRSRTRPNASGPLLRRSGRPPRLLRCPSRPGRPVSGMSEHDPNDPGHRGHRRRCCARAAPAARGLQER